MIALTVLLVWLYVDYRLNCARSRSRTRTLWVWEHLPDDTWRPVYPVRSWGEIDRERETAYTEGVEVVRGAPVFAHK